MIHRSVQFTLYIRRKTHLVSIYNNLNTMSYYHHNHQLLNQILLTYVCSKCSKPELSSHQPPYTLHTLETNYVWPICTHSQIKQRTNCEFFIIRKLLESVHNFCFCQKEELMDRRREGLPHNLKEGPKPKYVKLVMLTTVQSNPVQSVRHNKINPITRYPLLPARWRNSIYIYTFKLNKQK